MKGQNSQNFDFQSQFSTSKVNVIILKFILFSTLFITLIYYPKMILIFVDLHKSRFYSWLGNFTNIGRGSATRSKNSHEKWRLSYCEIVFVCSKEKPNQMNISTERILKSKFKKRSDYQYVSTQMYAVV